MSPFEYVSVLISIILGLGITQILFGVSEVIRRWKRLTLFGPYIIWIILVFVMHVREWWYTYQLKSTTTWHLNFFLFVALYPITLFVLANLLFPQSWPRKRFDMRKYYFKNWTKLFLLVIVLAFISILYNTFIDLLTWREQMAEILIITVTGTMILLRPTAVIIHFLFALALLVGLIASLVIQNDFLIIRA